METQATANPSRMNEVEATVTSPTRQTAESWGDCLWLILACMGNGWVYSDTRSKQFPLHHGSSKLPDNIIVQHAGQILCPPRDCHRHRCRKPCGTTCQRPCRTSMLSKRLQMRAGSQPGRVLWKLRCRSRDICRQHKEGCKPRV